ncbi:MAG: hypothetical protein JJ863_26750 [Deltaproteobacteria bacterium]|nr:hypothetical protein [Deltaproteobacteria bacterium]
MSEAEENPFTEPTGPKATRHHRILALTIGLPLASVLFVPWRRWRDWLFAWDLPDQTQLPVMVAGGVGVSFVIAAFVPERLRRLALTLCGLAAGACALWLLGALPTSSSDLRHVGLAATRFWVALAMFTAGAEMAMHRRPESRAISVGAFFGWLGILAAFFFVPVGPELDPEGTSASQMMAALERSYYRMSFVVPVFTYFSLIALLGLFQTLRRVGADRELAARRRFRSSWLAWVLYPVPMIALFSFGAYMMATHNDGDELSNLWLAFGLLYGTTVGGAVGVRSLLLREQRAREPIPKRALIGVGAAVAIAAAAMGVFQLFSSASNDAAADDIAWEMADALGRAIRGEGVERRFLGGYSELDLRNAEGVVELPADAEPVLVAFDVAHQFRGVAATAVFRKGKPAAWVQRASMPGQEWELMAGVETIAEADQGFGALVEQLGSSGCLAVLEEGALDEPAVAAAFERPPRLEPICGDREEERPAERVETLAGRGRVDRSASGGVQRYVVVFAAPGGAPIAVSGKVHANTGMAWIGNPTPWPASATE